MKRKNILLIHFLFWFYIINQALFPIYIGQMDQAYLISYKYLMDILITTLMNAFSFYLIYCTFPNILKIRPKITAVMAAITALVFITAFRTSTEYLLWKISFSASEKEMVFKWVYMWNNFRLVIITGTYAVLIRFMIKAFEARKLKDELINQQQASELALLRSQINPHFLFNTINNIYSLVYRKSDEAGEAVLRLSSIMRYMLFDATTDKVPLEKEVEYLKSFIELQKLRIRNHDFVSLKLAGDTGGRFIAPMLLISFVDNAFKHGSRKHHPGIIIDLSTERDLVSFEVVNYLKKGTLTIEEHSSGSSLVNIRRRLELIYPGRHKLVITGDEDTFKINLKIFN
ncbi:MAG: histidine kinase [Bacteroidales bacterium]|nr:histidine kinase [Bacteroidales bacterium]